MLMASATYLVASMTSVTSFASLGAEVQGRLRRVGLTASRINENRPKELEQTPSDMRAAGTQEDPA